MKAHVIPARPDTEYWFVEGCHILELSNSAEDSALSIARATERYVILEGTGMVEIGALQQEVGALDVVIIPPGCPQRIRNTGSGDLVFLAMCTPRFVPAAYTDAEADMQTD